MAGKIMDWIDKARRQRKIDFEPNYGPIRPWTDSRCFRREMIEELLDALNCAQWAKQKGEINRQQWKKMDTGIRSVIRLLEAACNERFLWETDISKVLNETKQAGMI